MLSILSCSRPSVAVITYIPSAAHCGLSYRLSVNIAACYEENLLHAFRFGLSTLKPPFPVLSTVSELVHFIYHNHQSQKSLLWLQVSCSEWSLWVKPVTLLWFVCMLCGLYFMVFHPSYSLFDEKSNLSVIFNGRWLPFNFQSFWGISQVCAKWILWMQHKLYSAKYTLKFDETTAEIVM